MRNAANEVSEYLESLPPEQRKELAAVRSALKKRLPKGYDETLQYGMITYVVPLKTFPAGYLGKEDVPLPFASLGAQKKHLAVYLMNVYGNPKLEARFRAAYAKSGKNLDMGKSCLRFRRAEELALDVIGEALASTPPAEYVEQYLSARGERPAAAKKPSANVRTSKTTAPKAKAKPRRVQ